MKTICADVGIFLVIGTAWLLGTVLICRFFAAAERHDQEGAALREDHKRRKRQRRWNPETTWDVHRATKRRNRK